MEGGGSSVDFVLVFLVSAALALGLTPLVRSGALRFGVVKRPVERSMHRVPVPHAGGLAIAAAVFVPFLYFAHKVPGAQGLIAGAIIILAFGVWDDLKVLSAKTKLAGQVLAAAAFALGGGQVVWLTNPFGHLVYLGNWGILVSILWVVAVMNTINLVDGLDGLAGGLSAIAAFALALIALHEGPRDVALGGLALAGACTGFLRYNFSPASIFMGDTGSQFLGFALGALAILGSAKDATAITLGGPMLALAIPIFDTGFAIMRRVRARLPIHLPDRGHLHHRLVDSGVSQKRAVLVLYAVAAIFGGAGVILVDVPSRIGFGVAAVLFAGALVFTLRSCVTPRTKVSVRQAGEEVSR